MYQDFIKVVFEASYYSEAFRYLEQLGTDMFSLICRVKKETVCVANNLAGQLGLVYVLVLSNIKK